jgi:glutamine amidotransferase
VKISIIKYNAGNIHSVRVALMRIGYQPIVTDDPDILIKSDKILFPGVGEARSAMNYLHQKDLTNLIGQFTQPVLGICLGLQLMCSFTEENNTVGLGVFDINVRRFETKLKVPHIGWNQIYELKNPLFKGINSPAYVYFIHSYFAETDKNTSAKSDYAITFSAALQKDNFYAVQFHPEKSGAIGEQILKNFLNL